MNLRFIVHFNNSVPLHDIYLVFRYEAQPPAALTEAFIAIRHSWFSKSLHLLIVPSIIVYANNTPLIQNHFSPANLSQRKDFC